MWLYAVTVVAAHTCRRTAEHALDVAEALEHQAARYAPYPITIDPRSPR